MCRVRCTVCVPCVVFHGVCTVCGVRNAVVCGVVWRLPTWKNKREGVREEREEKDATNTMLALSCVWRMMRADTWHPLVIFISSKSGQLSTTQLCRATHVAFPY